jgi:hypothetical protein
LGQADACATVGPSQEREQGSGRGAISEGEKGPMSKQTALEAVVGLLFMAFGVFTILGAFGVVPVRVAPDLRGSEWLIVCGGVSILLIGLAFIVGLTARSSMWIPLRIQLIQYLIGLGIVGLLTVVFTWIAVGPGPRQFAMAIANPFMASRSQGSEISGRIMFGFGAALLWLMLIGVGVSGARKLIRSYRRSRSGEL